MELYNVEMKDMNVPSSDGVHTLSGRIYLPDGKIKGLFHVVHGMTEHISRYDKFMREVSARGYAVFGYDHVGHGNTARDPSELGFIAHRGGWKILVDDVGAFADAARKECGDLPYFLMGHSMGSFIVRLAAVKFDSHKKLIVMGTGGPNPASGVGLALMKTIAFFRGEHYVSPLSYKLAFGSYNERFGNDDPYNWLSTDPNTRKIYSEDSFCTFKFSVSAMSDLLKLNSAANKKSWADSMNKEKPVLLVSGSEDPVGSYGEGVKKVRDMLESSGVTVEMKLYEGFRHEILNDFCHDEVLSDILSFIGE